MGAVFTGLPAPKPHRRRTMEPVGIITWLVVGLIAGCVAGFLMRGRGYGIVWDIIVGLVGAFVGGLIFQLLLPGAYGFWGSIAIAIIGACALIAVVRFVSRGRSKL
jgi:uncharacterized membrane protein YeaQ/YmgE (transglycosylase-associated protein family)